MEKQPNPLLWHCVFVLLMCAAAFGIYQAVQSVDYTWRWERIPQYIAYQAEQQTYADFDGTVVASNNGALLLQNDLDPQQHQAIAATGIQVAEGDTIFRGDVLATELSWKAGPIAWGIWVTVKLSLVAGVFAILLGTLAGLARLSPNPALRYVAVTYVELIRGTPLLVQIFIVYFFIGTVLNLDRFTAGVAALAVFTGAYVAEIVRAGISSIHKGQMEAGRSLGLTSAQTMRYVILPQAFKRVLPPLAGQFINLIKDSSLVSVISITDLTKAGREIVSSTFSPFEVWFTVALLYLVLTGSLSFVVRRLEHKYARSN
ncbi:amino acid ABC transporter permease [Aeromonas cavernicola]|uniref:Putative glutamine transport system permease protein GlnP n=1 Tax=Aeromonas cavernicola TaxID=1006623 RepID=A0A2H9U160_9GAMM|nr:amino acid ABC transporter permease [Aeromonas cavernicola]PJG57754.1 ABC transporter permease [Aeromonas cavernicola]